MLRALRSIVKWMVPVRTFKALVATLAVCTALALVADGLQPARANIFTKILREAGEAGGKATRHGIDFPGHGPRIVAKLPAKPGHLAVAAHVTPDGHWKFVNAKGDVFTAATPDEMSRAAKALSPDGTGANSKLELYLDEASLFENPQYLNALPKTAKRHIVVGKESYPLRPSVGATPMAQWSAVVRNNVIVPLTDSKAFSEAIYQLSRPLRKADIRVLSLKPSAKATLPPAPRINKTNRQAMVDLIDPGGLADALPSIRGQTVLITGRIERGSLHFLPEGGSPRTLDLAELKTAAGKADVNLIILQSPTPRQPGGRNWLWQTVEVGGLKDAIKRATFADFLSALGANRGPLQVRATSRAGRVGIEVSPPTTETVIPYTDALSGWMGEAVSSITGHVAVSAVSADMRNKKRQQELDIRIIPGIPSIYQFLYLGSLIAGLMAWGVSRDCWNWIWPREQRSEYTGVFGYYAARTIKFLIFLALFLPVAGIPMLILSLLLQIWTVLGWIWAVLTSPAWLWRRIRGHQS